MTWRRHGSLLLGGVGAALTVVLMLAARPAAILDLMGTSRWDGIAQAFGWGVLVLLARGARLSLVVGPTLRAGPATAVMAGAQLAAAVLPLRLGELALVPLLELAGIRGVVRGLSFAVLLRFLDLVALAAWATLAAALVGLRLSTALAVGAVATLVLAGIALAPRALRWALARWRHAGSLRRRALLQLLQVRRELRLVGRSPWRVIGAVTCSVAVWGGLWGLTAALLAAMDMAWPGGSVLAGVIGAAVGSSLPINAVGNFGSLEAGWTTALVASGVPAAEALAAGFATHLWSLAFALVLGLPAVAGLVISHSGKEARKLRATASDRRPSPGAE